MWALIVLTCLGLECSDIKILGVYSTEAACVEALDTIEQEQGASMCLRQEPEEIKT
jgi:hypothetical protein